jgi:2-amino-4-hydroxy-6-hydroxymethyldihydropteridine diphosphokinase
MRTAFLGLGSNVGSRRVHLQHAVDELDRCPNVTVQAVSPVYETEAHTVDPQEEQRPFLNAVVQVRTSLSPHALLRRGQALEKQEGRAASEERERWAPRPLDVDVLVVDDLTASTDALVLPHPRLGERRFVLRPWADLAPNFVVPLPFDATVQTLLDRCPDTGAIARTSSSLHLPADAP